MAIRSLKYRVLGMLRHLSPPRFFFRAPVEVPTLYLTFDDGPTPGVTDRLLDLLATHGAKASFFCIGNQLEHNQPLVQRIVEEGHLLGNHSFSHFQFSKMPPAEQIKEVLATDAVIQKMTGRDNRYFRAPYGRWTLGMLLTLWRHGKVPVHWSYDSDDYTKAPAAALIERFRRLPVSNGEIILLHDDLPLSIEILEVMLPEWQRAGFHFARIP
jgi:peptidoglycan/xylan/chitin deacetylase (PgdA/CDA1 family)